MYQRIAEQQQRLCICTRVFHAFKKKKKNAEGGRGDNENQIQIGLRVFLVPLNFVSNH